MLKPIHFIVALLFVFVGCSSDKTEPAPIKPETGKVTPVSATFPAAVFTDVSLVQQNKASLTILNQLIALINATPKDATLHLSIFLFDYPELIQAIKTANDRGVKLHVAMDMGREESLEVNPLTFHELKRVLEAKGNVIVPVYNDASSIAINHNKFVIFSDLETTAGKVQNVVFQTSHNFTLADARKFQDAVMLADAGLYGAFKTYWTDMQAKAASGMKNYNYTEYTDAAKGINGYFMPKRRNGTAYGDDTIIEFLNSIQDPASATIKIGMSDWTNSRLNIVEKLAELQAQGATIEVVVKNKIDDNIMTGLRQLQQKGAYLKVYDISKANIHSKFILIEGNWLGKNAKVLITGSHNFTNNALRNNNEVMVLLKDHALFANYTTYFENLKTVPGI
ncbi:phospholipase D-like domain-containing protein [Pontibacter populi]|uniref:phospholipase D n=1 Tax=Pontibacter populi TaxID=890055 RepID=A0ABV1RR53_9BACT